MFFKKFLLALVPTLALSCDTFEPPPPTPNEPPQIFQKTGRSAPLVISDDNKTLVMANTDDGTISIFDAETLTKKAQLLVDATDSEPWAVALSVDGSKAFVLLRKTGAIVTVSGLDTNTFQVGLPLLVGSEPTSMVLSPSGKTAYVASFVEGSVYVVDLEDFEVKQIVNVGGNPRGLCMTNDLDEDDTDETLFVTNFFSVPSGIVNEQFTPNNKGEGTDFGRKGIVHALQTSDLTLRGTIDLLPLADAGFPEPQNPAINVGTFPNQLFSCTVNNGRVYVPNMAASPRGAVKFNANVQGVVSVFDAATLTEIRDQVGQPSGTVNLNALVKLQSDLGGGRQFVTQPLDIAFVPGTEVGYVTSAGTDIELRVVWNQDGTITVGSPINFHIKVGQNPQGIVLNSDGTKGFVANRITRDISVIDFAVQDEVARVASSAPPSQETDPQAFAIHKGQRFFNTSFGRWSSEGWGSCAACHPDGLTDGVTWHFASGPRQSISMDATFSKRDPNDQRILNWTGIFDEIHDFELNTRGVSGGLGAVVDGNNVPIDLATAIPGENNQGLNGSVVSLNQTLGALPDWDQINEYVKSIRSLKANRQLDVAAIARGRDVFTQNRCQNCHGGDKWTISRRRYTPAFEVSEALKITDINATGLIVPAQNPNLKQLSTEDPNRCVTRNGVQVCGSPLAILRIACVLRDVGTYGILDPLTNALDLSIEVAANMTTRSQGIQGYNPPSLLSIAGTGPLLHHGQAETLDDLFSERFASHHQANSVNFLINPNDPQQAQQKLDLIQFLLSIDDTTEPIEPDAGQEICPTL